jgi:hypothetical protein
VEIISGTVFLRSAQRHPGGENNRPGGARLQYAKLGHSPDAQQLPKACATRMHALCGLCTCGATAFIHWVGPTAIHQIELKPISGEYL